MNAVTAFVVGLFVGWVIEWIIDWVYWRRRTAEMARRLEIAESRLAKEAELKKSEGIKIDYENQVSKLKADNTALQEKVTALEAQNIALQTPAAPPPGTTAAPQEKVTEFQADKTAAKDVTAIRMAPLQVKPDDLIVIKGIGPVISKKLNDAGIYTFRELAAITPERLREIVGDVIQRLADENVIIDQAKKLAAEQDRSANS